MFSLNRSRTLPIDQEREPIRRSETPLIKVNRTPNIYPEYPNFELPELKLSPSFPISKIQSSRGSNSSESLTDEDSNLETEEEKDTILTIPNSPNDLLSWHKAKQQTIINNIRLAKEEEIANTSRLYRKSFSKVLEDSIAQQKLEYIKTITSLRNEAYEIRGVISKRDYTINCLADMLTDTYLQLTEQRIKLGKVEKFNIESEKVEEHKPEIIEPKDKNLLAQVESLKLQIKSLKNVCEMYQDDASKANEKVKKLEHEKKELVRVYEKEIEELNKELEAKTLEYQDYVKSKSKELENVRFESKKEIELRDILLERLKDHIEILKGELKNAKIVLQSPRLRMQYHEKLKDYIDDVQNSSPLSETQKSLARKNSPKTPRQEKKAKIIIKAEIPTEASILDRSYVVRQISPQKRPTTSSTPRYSFLRSKPESASCERRHTKTPEL